MTEQAQIHYSWAAYESALPGPTQQFQLPDGWYVLWCVGCGYALTFDEAAATSYDLTEEWDAVIQWAMDHEHVPVLVIEEDP